MERKTPNHNKAHNRKKWVYALAVLLFLVVLLGKSESVMEAESTRIYQVYCLGDSITYGSGLPQEQRPLACYPAQLQELLGAKYQVMNYGVSGRTLTDVPERSYRDTGYLDMVKLQSPDILVVMLGTNDSKEDVWDAQRYQEEYVALVEELQAIESEPDIYLMIPPEAFPYEDGVIVYGINNDIIHDEIRHIVRTVSEETGAGLIDLYAVTENHPEYFVDGVHPNEQGYEVLAKAVYEQIVEDRGIVK